MGRILDFCPPTQKKRLGFIYGRQHGASASAFTLIELLVVVAIVALLITILIPSLSQAKSQAKSTACKANLRSLARAGIVYSTEYNDAAVPTNWDPLLLPYLDASNTASLSIKVWTCPATVGDPLFTVPPATKPNWYGLNTTGGGLYKIRLSKVDRPTETVFFADTGSLSPPSTRFSQSIIFLYSSYISGLYQYYMFHGRHQSKGNVAWYDGHVSDERPVMPPDAPNIASMKAGSSGYLSPASPNISWAAFTASPMHNYYFYWNKTQQLNFWDSSH